MDYQINKKKQSLHEAEQESKADMHRGGPL